MCICREEPSSIGFSKDHYTRWYSIDFRLLDDEKHFAVYQCAECQTAWILDKWSANHFFTRLDRDADQALLREWRSHERTARHLKEAADAIGSASEEYYEVPCKAWLEDDSMLDFCVLTRWPFHPKIAWRNIPVHRYVYAGQVRTIGPSEYAIPLEHRISMRQAQQIWNREEVPLILRINDRMQFRSEGCRTYYLDDLFLRYENIRGTDVTEIHQRFECLPHCLLKNDLKPFVTLILFDEME